MEEKEIVNEEINETEENPEVVEEKIEVKKERKNKHKEKIEALEKQNAELKDKLLRNAAELENFKRRTNEERIKDRKYASCDLVNDLVSILTNLDKCVNMETEDPMLKNFLIGFKMIDNQLFDRLYQDGLEEIKVEVGMDFDPNIHHAIETTENADFEPNKITEVVQKGYKYKDRIIKPAMVKVNK
jgi:molecular chaperone GrpE